MKPITIWLSGLPASGKTTIARGLDIMFRSQGHPAVVLDGDVLRKGVCADLTFSEEDRETNVFRTAHIAKILNRANISTIVALITPRDKLRTLAGNVVQTPPVFHVFVDCPYPECLRRDPKGHYRRALDREIVHFTGVDDPFERPAYPDLVVRTDKLSVEESVALVWSHVLVRIG